MTTIEMARASHLDVYGLGKDHEKFVASLERFATLIRADERSSWPAEMEAMERQVNILTDALADERERMKWDVHSCGPTCKRYACVALAQAKVDENEACAKVADEWSKRRDDVGGYIARNIRARRNT
jgi:hypothetical protein